MERKTHLADRSNYGSARKASQIKYLIIHYTANDGDSDEGNGNYFSNPLNPKSSAHYFVDDDSCTQSVPDLYVAYSVGGSKWNDCAQTGGGTMYGIINNTNSISIEMCDAKRDGVIQATEQTMANTAILAKELMKKYNITIDRVYRHFDVNGKHCPAYMMDASKWAAFKARLTEEEDIVTQAQFNQMMEVYLADLATQPPADWSLEDRTWAEQVGLIKGDETGNKQYKSFLTREQMAVLMHRLHDMG